MFGGNERDGWAEGDSIRDNSRVRGGFCRMLVDDVSFFLFAVAKALVSARPCAMWQVPKASCSLNPFTALVTCACDQGWCLVLWAVPNQPTAIVIPAHRSKAPGRWGPGLDVPSRSPGLLMAYPRM